MGNQIFLINKKEKTIYLFWKKSYIPYGFEEFYKNYYNFYKLKEDTLNDPKLQHLKEYFTDKFNKLKDFLFDKIVLNNGNYYHKLKEDVSIEYENYLFNDSDMDKLMEDSVIVNSIYTDDDKYIGKTFKDMLKDLS